MFRGFVATFLHVLWVTKTIYLALFGLIALGGFVIGRVEGFPLGDGLYFAMITGLTIGYGDVTVVTSLGRFIAICIGFVGIVMTGMIVSAALFALHKTLKELHPDKYG